MSTDWADKIAQQLLSRGLLRTGVCLILGASDTGKTTLAAALTRHIVSDQPISIVDADIGQSHIGPPATVGWAFADSSQSDFSQLTASGISFVGDVTPVGHLLQLTAAIVQCVQQASKATKLIIVDTPGLIRGPAAAALWWTVQRVLKPNLILAVQRSDELSDILAGLRTFDMQLELIASPQEIPIKSPQDRRRYRENKFRKYFQNSFLYNICLSDIATQPSRNFNREDIVRRLVALRNGKGTDMAIGVICDWQKDNNVVKVKTPKVDIEKTRCIVIGDVSIDIVETTNAV